MPINSSMAASARPPGVEELIDHSVTRLTVLLGALKTIHDHETLLGPVVRAEILRSALRHGLELQSLIDRVRSETAVTG